MRKLPFVLWRSNEQSARTSDAVVLFIIQLAGNVPYLIINKLGRKMLTMNWISRSLYKVTPNYIQNRGGWHYRHNVEQLSKFRIMHEFYTSRSYHGRKGRDTLRTPINKDMHHHGHPVIAAMLADEASNLAHNR